VSPASRRSLVAKALVVLGLLGNHQAFPPSSHGGHDVDATTPSPVRWRVVPAPRGEILDRGGAPLASSRLAFDIYAIPGLFTPEVRAGLIDLLELGDEEVAELDGRAARLGGDEAGPAIALLEGQTRQRAALVAAADLGGAVEVQVGSQRVYPHGPLAAHVIGYVGRKASTEGKVAAPVARAIVDGYFSGRSTQRRSR
jgi:penicillin-binding protein 2